MRFEGKTVLLSGATGGFGTVIAERFAREGANLVLSDVAREPLENLAGRLDASSATLAGDIRQEELSRDLVALARDRFGRLDIAINNAGIAQSFVKLHLVPSDEARKVIDTDVMAVFFAMKHQLQLMEQQHHKNGSGGVIVNIASVAGIAGAPRLSVYSAAKHAVVGLTRSAAAEYAGHAIRVNAICPSFARTSMVSDLLDLSPKSRAESEAHLTRGVPMGRLANVSEVVEAVLFAASPENSFMTGQALAVDGGITAI